jgi:hypothetical protein
VTVQQEAIWTVILPDEILASAASWPRRWSLSKMIDRGGSRQLNSGRPYDVVGWAVTGHVAATAAWAPAPVCWVADFSNEPPLGAMRIDPVHLAAGPRGLTLIPPGQLDIGEAEAQRLSGALADALRDRAIGIRVGAPDRWYMSLGYAPDGPWRTPDDAAGRNLLECLPGGDDSAALRNLLNEIQMVLHQQADNEARRDRGRPEINSVWPWGWAQRPVPRVGSVVEQVYAEHPYALGLARLADIPTRGAGVPEKDLPAAAAVVVPPTGRAADPEWLETGWCRPLLRALARRRIQGVRLVSESGRIFEVSRKDRRRFWRRSRRSLG